MSRKTLDLLETFVAQGGTAVLCTPTATLSSERGEDPDLAARLAALGGPRVAGIADKAALPARQAMAEAFAGYARDVRLEHPGIENIVVTHYRKEETNFYLFVNTDRENGVDVAATVAATGCAALWKPETGEPHPIAPKEVARAEGRSTIAFYLPPAASHLIGFSAESPVAPSPDSVTPSHGSGATRGETGTRNKPSDRPLARLRAGADGETLLELPDSWDFRPLRANVLVLNDWRLHMAPEQDHPLRTMAQRLYETAFVLDVDLPRARLLIDGLLTDKVWNRSTSVAVSVSMNGQAVPGFEKGEYLDHLIREAEAGPLLKRGENRLRIQTSGFLYEPGALLHPAFLTGDFALERRGESWVPVAPKPGRKRGSWTDFGYPFYSGAGAYSQTFLLPAGANVAGGTILLRLSGVADLAEVFLNGRSVGVAAWEPWEIDLTPALRDGENHLEVRVVNSLTNILEENSKASGLLGRARIVRVG